MRVVLHAPTAGALTRARRNLRNLRAATPDAEVRIVANADAVAAALANPDAVTDRYLSLCENTLQARHLTPPSGIETVAAAVLELVRLQEEGWCYIRA
jgi:uncharacterized protein